MKLVPRCTALLIASLIAASFVARHAGAGAGRSTTNAAVPGPIDDDMHHFMEYVFEPAYQRLKDSLADEPSDKSGWKGIKGDALTLAECANLLWMRAPEDDPVPWRAASAAVRVHGAACYDAARQQDYRAARNAYRAMLKKCNTCHQEFAEGEHQLQP